jgi:hypothetical protein
MDSCGDLPHFRPVGGGDMGKTHLKAVLAFAALCAAPGQAALVANGDFETGTLSGWTLFGDQNFVGVDDASEHAGTYGAFAGSETPAGFSQAIVTTAGQNYTVSFWLKAEKGDYVTSKPNSFSATFGGATLLSFVDTSPFNYTKYSFDVVAVGITTNLVFTFTDKFSYLDLDDVSVVAKGLPPAVPEPATWGMLLAGFGLIGGVARYRRNRATACLA